MQNQNSQNGGEPEVPIHSVMDLPFPERDVWTLLNLSPRRKIPDENFYGFGYALLPEIELIEQASSSHESQNLKQALVLALHAFDEAYEDDEEPAPEHDLDLAFWLDEDKYYGENDAEDLDLLVTVRLSLFLQKRLPSILAAHTPHIIVLALCNPEHRQLQFPAELAPFPLYYGMGNVTSWMRRRDPQNKQWSHTNILPQLRAEQWLCVVPKP